MSLTHRDLAGLVSSLYGDGPAQPWLYRSNPDANVYMGIVRRGDHLIVVTRGSFDFEDWLHDFRVKKTVPGGRPELGAVHDGFYGGTPEAWDIVDWYFEPDTKLVFCGHSLGAARAVLLAGHAVANKRPPAYVRCWGEPACGTETLAALLAGIPAQSDANFVGGEFDPVTQSTLAFGFKHCWPMTDVSAPPANPKWWDPFDLHHFALYASVTPATEI
jgi:hypothetical protein